MRRRSISPKLLIKPCSVFWPAFNSLEFDIQLFRLSPLLQFNDLDILEQSILAGGDTIALDQFEQGQEGDDHLQAGRCFTDQPAERGSAIHLQLASDPEDLLPD